MPSRVAIGLSSTKRRCRWSMPECGGISKLPFLKKCQKKKKKKNNQTTQNPNWKHVSMDNEAVL